MPATRLRLVRPGRWILRVLSVLLCLSFWQLASDRDWTVLGARFENVPSPTEVWEAGKALVESPKLWLHLWSSTRRIFLGFAIAAALAIPLGLLIGRFRWSDAFLTTPLEVLRPIPAVAWIPLAILLWPTAETSMVFITFIGAFFPILLNTVQGVRSVDEALIQASRVLGAGPIDLMKEVILPGAASSIVTGLSIGMGTSWFSLITAEMVAGQFGIGYFTWEAYTLQNYPDIVLGMVLIGILGMVSSSALRLAGRLLTPWQTRGGRTQ